MNWGYKIGILFASFVVLIIGLVTICVRQDDIFLVSEKYYEKEIAYQQQIDIEQNTAELKEKPSMAYKKEGQIVTFNYPEDFKDRKVSGTILFFRPSDATKDFSIPLKRDLDSQQSVSVASLEKGLWRVKMEMAADNKKYYFEERLVVL